MTGEDLVLRTLQKDAEDKIYEVRGMAVMVDSDLAEFFDVQTMRINEAARRNTARFPEDFRFQLTEEEWEEILISQDAISKPKGRGGRRRGGPPWVYTRSGAMVLAGVLKSKRADELSVAIPRAFDEMERRLRGAEVVLERIAGRLDELESDTISRDEFERFQRQMTRALKKLGEATMEVEKRLPPIPRPDADTRPGSRRTRRPGS
jgi:hypothetical protein